MNLKGTLILFFAVVLTLDATSQFKNIRLDEQKGNERQACEPSIAINPKYPNNVVAGSFPSNVYYTKDAGKSWAKSQLPSSGGAFGHPSVIADEKGNFYYFCAADPAAGEGGSESEKSGRIVMHKSEDGGATWSDAESIGINHPKDQSKQSATTDTRGNLFVAWTQFDEYGNGDPACQSNVRFSMSKNGKKWTDPVTISQTPGNCADDNNTPNGAVPAVTFDGKVFVAWAHQGKIFLDRSFNGGGWWLTNDIVIAEQTGGWDLAIPGHGRSNGTPVLMSDNSKSQYRGSLYVVWADQRNGEDDTDIWFSRSHNFGDNWSSPTRVNNDGKGKHQYMPSMALDPVTGYVYVLYYDRRNHDDNATDVYLAYSNDGGGSFKNVLVSEEAFTPEEGGFFSDYTNVSSHKGIVMPVWTRMDDKKTSIWTAVIRHEELEK